MVVYYKWYQKLTVHNNTNLILIFVFIAELVRSPWSFCQNKLTRRISDLYLNLVDRIDDFLYPHLWLEIYLPYNGNVNCRHIAANTKFDLHYTVSSVINTFKLFFIRYSRNSRVSIVSLLQGNEYFVVKCVVEQECKCNHSRKSQDYVWSKRV